MVLATLAQGAGPSGAAAEMEQLRTENEALREMVKRLAKENAELKAELQSLKQALDKAGIDVAALSPASPVPDQPQEPSPDTKKDPNTVVAEAIQQCTASVAAIDRADTTDIQKRQGWLEAIRQLDAVLRQSRVTITYTLNDVVADSGSNTALLNPASAMIKSSDPLVGHVVFEQFYQVRIQATEKEAQKITKTSSVTMRGWLALNVDLSKPASEQPQFVAPWRMPGYRPVGSVPGTPSLGYYTIMIKEGYVVEVDGVPRKMPQAGYSGD